jgi:hypothetical protein
VEFFTGQIVVKKWLSHLGGFVMENKGIGSKLAGTGESAGRIK